MNIPSPQQPITDPGYNAELQEVLDFPVRDLVDQIALAGWNKRAAFQVLAYEEDTDSEDAPGETTVSSAEEDPPVHRLLDALLHGRPMQ